MTVNELKSHLEQVIAAGRGESNVKMYDDYAFPEWNDLQTVEYNDAADELRLS